MDNERRQKYIEKIAQFRLIDDTYMTAFFNGQPELIQFVLRIILDKDDLIVKNVQVQKSLKNIQGRSSVLDVFAEDSKGVQYDIEVQSAPDGAKPKRARYYISLMDSNALLPQDDFDKLPETYVIFITETDVLNKGEPIYFIDRTIQGYDEPFGDEAHIIYVNGSYKADTPLGELVHDFMCATPSEMKCTPLAERAHDLKETEGGVGNMCKIMEELNAEAAEERSRETVLRMLQRGKLSLEEISEDSGLSLDEVKKLQSQTAGA